MDDGGRRRLHQCARKQAGVVSLDQALEAGMSAEAVRRRVRNGEWYRVGHCAYQLADHEETARSRTFAAALSVGPGATLVGRSATWWWGLSESPPAVVELAVAPPAQPRARPGVRVRRRAVDPVDRAHLAGLPVLKRAPATLDGAVLLGLDEGAALVDRALQQERVTLGALVEVHHRTLGRQGAPLAGRLLVLAAGGARSEAERLTHRSLRSAGIGGWRPNAEIVLPGFGRVVADLLFEEEKTIVEIDGWAYHRDLRAFLRDGPRQSALVAAGYVVLRTHWYEQRDDAPGFCSALARTLATRSAR